MSLEAKELTLGDKWDALKNALTESESKNYFYASTKLDEAKRIYDQDFKAAALNVTPEADQLIENAFSYNAKYIKERDLFEASLNRQIIDKSIYTIAFFKVKQALDNQDDKALFDWFSVLEKKFAISKNDSFVTNKALEEIRESPDKINQYEDVIINELLGIFKLKIIEELEEAIVAVEQEKTNDAIKFTYEGLYYYKTLHHSISGKIGSEKAEILESKMAQAIDVTRSGMPNQVIGVELTEILAEVQLIINEYDGIKSQEGATLSGIKDRLTLVKEEYKDAVFEGKIINQVEYDETLVFITNTISLFNENKASILKISDSETAKLEANLNRINQIISSHGEVNEVQSLVSESITIIDSLIDKVGEVSEITPLVYIQKIEDLLNQVKIEYGKGNTQQALDLATSAYLDNYEFIEKDIAQSDIHLMEKIEQDMRVELIQMIRDGAQIKDVEQHIDTILEDLNSAKMVVPEFGPITVLVLFASVLAVLFSGRKIQTNSF